MPVVAWLDTPPDLHINPHEVVEAFWQPLDTLGKPVVEEWHLRGMLRQVPFWPVHRVPLWGLTACVLAELMAILDMDP